MHLVDWFIVAAYLIWVVYDGLKRTKTSSAVEGYFLANRSLPWWAVGLTVMATQMSAITLVGTTGQGYADGMRDGRKLNIRRGVRDQGRKGGGLIEGPGKGA